MQQQNSLINSPPSPQMPYTATREQDNIIQFKEETCHLSNSPRQKIICKKQKFYRKKAEKKQKVCF